MLQALLIKRFPFSHPFSVNYLRFTRFLFVCVFLDCNSIDTNRRFTCASPPPPPSAPFSRHFSRLSLLFVGSGRRRDVSLSNFRALLSHSFPKKEKKEKELHDGFRYFLS